MDASPVKTCSRKSETALKASSYHLFYRNMFVMEKRVNSFSVDPYLILNLHDPLCLKNGDLRNMTTIVPTPKTAETEMSVYVKYFDRVAAANKWSDEDAALMFAGMLEVGSSTLDNMDDNTLKSFNKIKETILPKVEFNREAEVETFFTLSMKSTETVDEFLTRCCSSVATCYPKFAKANRDVLTRDRFVHGLPQYLCTAVVNKKADKLEECVESAFLAHSRIQSLGLNTSYEWKDNKSKTTITCAKCNKAGHYAHQCTSNSGKESITSSNSSMSKSSGKHPSSVGTSNSCSEAKVSKSDPSQTSVHPVPNVTPFLAIFNRTANIPNEIQYPTTAEEMDNRKKDYDSKPKAQEIKFQVVDHRFSREYQTIKKEYYMFPKQDTKQYKLWMGNIRRDKWECKSWHRYEPVLQVGSEKYAVESSSLEGGRGGSNEEVRNEPYRVTHKYDKCKLHSINCQWREEIGMYPESKSSGCQFLKLYRGSPGVIQERTLLITDKRGIFVDPLRHSSEAYNKKAEKTKMCQTAISQETYYKIFFFFLNIFGIFADIVLSCLLLSKPTITEQPPSTSKD
ncbi:hypothetical protein GQR58_009147 [Nymphon striatum]|nr:hypothetical protein GQR58_009147 [Nymphon striatum]